MAIEAGRFRLPSRTGGEKSRPHTIRLPTRFGAVLLLSQTTRGSLGASRNAIVCHSSAAKS